MQTIKKLEKENQELYKQVTVLYKKIAEQNELIQNMRDVLRFCARDGVGTYYQQQSAKEMLLNSKKLVWSRCNPDGTYNEEYKRWIFACGGQEALDRNNKEEQELM